jgi:hypothetical protein
VGDDLGVGAGEDGAVGGYVELPGPADHHRPWVGRSAEAVALLRFLLGLAEALDG